MQKTPLTQNLNTTLYALLVGCFITYSACSIAALAPIHRSGPDYDYYARGDVNAATPHPVAPGLALFGGGDWPPSALRWLVGHAGDGHIVILRASGTRELEEDFYQDIPEITSVETLVIHGERAASDPAVLAVIRHADGIFIGGGDQSNYVRLWKGTPLAHSIDEHARAGKPVGGTSAGLAILGGYVYGCLDSISVVSSDALAQPTGPGITLVRHFLHLPFLQRVITDSHFSVRARLGRLVTFVARLIQEENDTQIVGLGIDQGAALLIDADGIGHLRVTSPGFAWLVRPLKKPDAILAGRPLNYAPFTVTGIGPDSRVNFVNFEVTQPAFLQQISVENGHLVTLN